MIHLQVDPPSYLKTPTTRREAVSLRVVARF